MAEHPTGLTGSQQRAVQALLSAKSVSAAGPVAHVSERPLFRWLSEPAFRAALTAAESNLIDAATRRLLQLQGAALDTLETLLGDDTDASAGVRLRAAQVALEHLLRLREMRDIEQRLTALEAQQPAEKR